MRKRDIGNRIRVIRISRNMTQEQLAEKAGISTTHVSVIERGVKTPQLDTFIDICNALEVSPDIILEDFVLVTSEKSVDEVSLLLKEQPADIQRRIINAIKAALQD